MIAVSQFNTTAPSPFTACCSRVFVYASVLKVTLVYQSIVESQVTGRVKRDMKRSEGYTLLFYGWILSGQTIRPYRQQY